MEYELTDLGRSLWEPVAALGPWAASHAEEIGRAQEAFDRRLAAEEAGRGRIPAVGTR